MTTSDSFSPDWISSPVETVLDLLRERGVTVTELRRGGTRAQTCVAEFVAGRTDITEEIAQALQGIVGGSVSFWLRRQSAYRATAERVLDSEAKNWISQLPLRDMKSWGWIPALRDPLNLSLALLYFFQVPNIAVWRSRYSSLLTRARFKTSPSFEAEFGAVVAWLRRGELLAEGIKCSGWSTTVLRDVLGAARGLSRQRAPSVFLPKLKSLCASAGVALVVARAPAGCRASGATFFLNDGRAVILLSFRYKTDDQFWFSFFHEVGHLLLHDRGRVFIETGETPTEKEESEANDFAEEMLIPTHFRSRVMEVKPNNAAEVVRLARAVGISPGILIGQLQHHGVIDHKRYNGYKRRYTWEENGGSDVSL